MSRVLLLGLDGATFSVLQPAFDAGHMPHLKALLEAGASGVLTSTVPPYTPPGWTSIFTGMNPGNHGIFGFTLGNAQNPQGLVRLDRVRAPAVWNAANAQGARVGLFNVPMTYPPPAVDAFAVSGMMTPEGQKELPEGFTHPPTLADELIAAAGSYSIDIDVDYEKDWRSTAIIDRLSRNLLQKRDALRFLLGRHSDIEMLFVVLEAPDRLLHVHYKYLDPRCEHFYRPQAEAIRARAWRFFDEMDDVIAELTDFAGRDGYVVTMSDHGFGPKEKSVNVNLALMQWGLLVTGTAGGLARSAGVRKVARRAKTIVPRKLWTRARGAVQSRIDWSRTRAFAAPAPQQGIYVNLEGREPYGTVRADEYEGVRAEIIERFESLIDPDDGRRVAERVYRREEVMSGPQATGAPDLFPICRDYSYELSVGLYSPSILDDHRELPRGFHHMDGIFGIAGPGIERASGLRARVYDIAPTALYLAGLRLPHMDGRVLTEVLPASLIAKRPVQIEEMDLPLAGEGARAAPYSVEQEAQIEESLRNLGYL